MNGISALIRATRGFASSLCYHMKTQQEIRNLKPGREASPELDHGGTLISDFQPTEM